MKSLHARAALLAAALIASAAPSDAAVCLYNNLNNAKSIREIRVDSRGVACEFTNLGTTTTAGSAFEYLSRQTRSITAPWTVLVRPGSGYTQASTAVPTYTHIKGEPNIASSLTVTLGRPKVTLTATTGALITMGDFSSWSGVDVTPGATTMTGAVKVFDTVGVTASISDTLITIPTTLADTQNVIGINNGAAGVVTVKDVNFLSVGTRTKAWGLLNLGESADVTGGRWAGSASQLMMFQNNSSGKTLRLNFVQIDTLAGGTDLTNTAGTLRAYFTPYVTSSGTITGTAAPTATLAATATAAAANGANCSAGSAPLGVDTAWAAESCTAFQLAQVAMPVNANDACVAGTFAVDASFAAFCVATNTWVRVAVATWP